MTIHTKTPIDTCIATDSAEQLAVCMPARVRKADHREEVCQSVVLKQEWKKKD